jgi:ABC-type multidrug transport system fused ATPase/permease subunit
MSCIGILILVVCSAFAEIALLSALRDLITIASSDELISVELVKPFQIFMFILFSTTVLRIINTVYQSKFTFGFGGYLSEKIMHAVAMTNTRDNQLEGNIISTISEKVDAVLVAFILPLIQIIYSLFILLCVAFFIADAALNPDQLFQAGFLIIVLITLYGTFYVFISRYISRCGQQLYKSRSLLIERVKDLLALRDVLIRTNNIIIDKLSSAIRTKNFCLTQIQIWGSIPKYILEFILFALIFSMIYLGDHSTDPKTLTLLLFSLLRTMPFLQQIYTGLISIVSVYPAWKDVCSIFDSSADTNKNIFAFNITKNEPIIVEPQFNKKSFLNDSLILQPNTITHITGPSGTGKSTLLRELKLFIQSSQNIAFTTALSDQHPAFFSGSVEENVYMIPDELITENDKSLLFSLSEDLGFNERMQELLNNDNSEILTTGGKNLSGGERYKLSMMRSALSNADIIMFDEPFAAFDDISIKKAIEFIEKLSVNKCVIIVSHANVEHHYSKKIHVLNVVLKSPNRP